MKKSLSALVTMTALSCLATPAFAQDVSGQVDLKSSYTLEDFLYVDTPDPVVQGYLDVAIGDTGCSAVAWGNASLGEQVGQELDLGGSCEFEIAADTTVTLWVSRDILFDEGVPDMTSMIGTVVHGPVDATVGVYIWDGGLADGFAAQVGYTKEVDDFTFRGSLHYAHGLGDTDIVFAGLSVSRPVVGNLSASIQGYVPLVKSADDTREARLVAGLSWSF